MRQEVLNNKTDAMELNAVRAVPDPAGAHGSDAIVLQWAVALFEFRVGMTVRLGEAGLALSLRWGTSDQSPLDPTPGRAAES